MLKIKHTHSQYQSFVKEALTNFYISTKQEISIFINFDYLAKIWNADLTGIVSIIKSTYASSNEGKPPKDAVALFRSILLMTLYGETCISKWVKLMRSYPFFAIISGFLPACCCSSDYIADSIPGAATFHDFINRLAKSDKSLRRFKSKKKRKKPRKRGKKNQKGNQPAETLTSRLMNRVVRYDEVPIPDSIESMLNNILKEIFVLPSLEMGILGDPNNFNTAGDGTSMPTNASHYGKKTCKCKEKCSCPRLFLDPSASWGWDSYREVYYYGHTYHLFTACDSKYDLPLHIKCVSAKRHDSVTGIFALRELLLLYPQIHFSTAAFDSAYDTAPFYLLLNHYGIDPIIDLNPRRSSETSTNKLVHHDKDGVLRVIKCGKKMRNWGIMKDSYRHKYLFPVQCDHCDKCSLKSSKTHYEHTIDNPRFSGSIVRGSKRWIKRYKRRTTTERVNDRIKYDFKVKNAMCLSRNVRSVRTFVAAFCCYLDAWYNENPVNVTDIFSSLVSA